jgi:hypothetical protein
MNDFSRLLPATFVKYQAAILGFRPLALIVGQRWDAAELFVRPGIFSAASFYRQPGVGDGLCRGTSVLAKATSARQIKKS